MLERAREVWKATDGARSVINLFYVFVKVVSQPYAANLLEEYVIRGNSAIIKCHLPAFVSDFLAVIAWFDGETPLSANEESRLNSGTSRRRRQSLPKEGGTGQNNRTKRACARVRGLL